LGISENPVPSIRCPGTCHAIWKGARLKEVEPEHAEEGLPMGREPRGWRLTRFTSEDRAPVVVARHDDGGTPLIPGQLGENDATEVEHSACALDKIDFAVETGLVSHRAQSAGSRGHGCHWQGLILEQFDDDMQTHVRGDAAASKFGRELPRRGIDDDLLHVGDPVLGLGCRE
jgi:hypothetical protein